MKLLVTFGLNIIISIIIIIVLTVTNLPEVEKLFVIVIVICGIKKTNYHTPKLLVL